MKQMSEQYREMKFRGKRVDKDKWVYGNLQVPSKDNVPYFMWDKDDNNWQVEVYPRSVGQYIGIKDINNIEIYEGDILRSFDSQGNAIIHTIVWDNSLASFVAVLNNKQYQTVLCSISEEWIKEFNKEVVGNIFDNKDFSIF